MIENCGLRSSSHCGACEAVAKQTILPSQVEFELSKERSDAAKPKILGPS